MPDPQHSSIRPIFSNLTFEQVVLDTSLKQRDAESEKEVYKAFTYFKWMMDYLSNYMPSEERVRLDEDYIIYVRKREEIENTPDTTMNSSSKEEQINKLKMIFMETHKRYVMLAWPRAGIIHVEDEGIMDFTDVDYITTRRIIRSAHITSSIEAEGKKTNKEDQKISDSVMKEEDEDAEPIDGIESETDTDSK